MSRIARALGIGRSTLYRKLRDYGLEGDAERDAA
jgi:transcriptional regulator of acetoin/glycerol metabolism